MALAWAALTGSAPAFAANVRDAATSVAAGRSAESDANRYAPIAGGRPLTDAELLGHYFDEVRRTSEPDAVSVPGPECRSTVLPRETTPLTTAGMAMARSGIDPGAVNGQVRVVSSLLFQGGAVAGCALLWWWAYRSRRPRRTAGMYAELSAAGLVLLVAMLVAPQLGDSYGLLRLYQQVLLLFAPLILLALIRLAGRARPAVHVVVLGCLLTMVGLVPQLIGGYEPQLNLNNAGPYFRALYATRADVAAMAWVRGTLPPASWVVSDNRGAANVRAMTGLFPQEGVVPGVVPEGAYLVLPAVDGDQVSAVAVAGDRVLTYVFPLHCVTGGRPLLFADGPGRVYGPAVQP
jgi:hypothetical protein